MRLVPELDGGRRPAYGHELSAVETLPPVQPGLILAAALNYWEHAEEMHRVVCEPEPRQSMAFFHLPNWDAEIACIPGEPPRYEPVTAGEHIMSKFERAVKI